MDLHESIKKYKGGVKDITIKRYVSNVNKMRKDLNYNNYDFLKNIKEVINYLNNKSDSTKKAYLNSIIVSLKSLDKFKDETEEYIKIRDDLNNKYFDSKKDNQKNEKEINNWISLDEWDGIIKQLQNEIVEKKIRSKKILSKDDYELLLKLFILQLYRKYPIRNEFAMMQIKTPNQFKNTPDEEINKNNYLVMGSQKGKFILNNHKTNGKYGEKVLDIDNPTYRLLKQFLKFNSNPNYLISGYNGKPLNHNNLSKFIIGTFKELTGKNIGSQALRKIYLSDKYSDVLEDMKKDAKIMGHSMNTAQKIYIKTD